MRGGQDPLSRRWKTDSGGLAPVFFAKSSSANWKFLFWEVIVTDEKETLKSKAKSSRSYEAAAEWVLRDSQHVIFVG